MSEELEKIKEAGLKQNREAREKALVNENRADDLVDDLNNGVKLK